MESQEIKAMKDWIDQRPPTFHLCTFAGMESEPESASDDTYVCIHGKRLKWADARRALGLVQ